MNQSSLGEQIVQGIIEFGFKVTKNGEIEAEELNKILKDEKMEYLFQFIAVKILKKKKASIMDDSDVDAIAQLEQIPREKVTVDYALSLYEKLDNYNKINQIRETDPDEDLK